ncbi:MAG: SDR family NAD(P)-dependent oxidoreductase [Dysgonamonadaceae bacterium]|nr:SDR family NAD(P)-dependent oxidoreductase [Dysgonamonadaceae bacterium]
MYKKFDLKGKTALVTGASKGLGKSIAKGLSLAGANLIITSRHLKELQATKEELLHQNDKISIECMEVDHSKWKDIPCLFKEIKKTYEIDILVNNVGTGLLKPIEEMTNEQWDYILSLNVSNMMAMCREFVPYMKERKNGRIINMASLFGVVALTDRTAYCASKGAVISFTRALALELATYNITVNCISCGPMRTPLMNDSWNDPQKREYFSKIVPLNRWGEPDDIMGTAILLASEAGSYITGQNIIIDGGASAQ